MSLGTLEWRVAPQVAPISWIFHDSNRYWKKPYLKGTKSKCFIKTDTAVLFKMRPKNGISRRFIVKRFIAFVGCKLIRFHAFNLKYRAAFNTKKAVSCDWMSTCEIFIGLKTRCFVFYVCEKVNKGTIEIEKISKKKKKNLTSCI